MSKKVLVLSGSPRKGGNSDTLCNEFIRGAKEAGHETSALAVEFVTPLQNVFKRMTWQKS